MTYDHIFNSNEQYYAHSEETQMISLDSKALQSNGNIDISVLSIPRSRILIESQKKNLNIYLKQYIRKNNKNNEPKQTNKQSINNKRKS